MVLVRRSPERSDVPPPVLARLVAQSQKPSCTARACSCRCGPLTSTSWSPRANTSRQGTARLALSRLPPAISRSSSTLRAKTTRRTSPEDRARTHGAGFGARVQGAAPQELGVEPLGCHPHHVRLGVAPTVAPGHNSVLGFDQNRAGVVDQQRAEGMIAVLPRPPGHFDRSDQMLIVLRSPASLSRRAHRGLVEYASSPSRYPSLSPAESQLTVNALRASCTISSRVKFTAACTAIKFSFM